MNRTNFPVSAICCLVLMALLFASLGAVSAQSMDMMDSMDKMDDMMMDDMEMMPPQTCNDLPGNIMVSSDSMGVQCQDVGTGGIGVMSIVDAGVLAAVDVWGPFGVDAEVCFASSGSITFLDATTSPRMAMSPEYYMSNGMTCTHIMHPGTVV